MRSVLVAALIGLAAALTAPAAANAASCWQHVLEDWRDGHLDRVYPVHCYRDALKYMPEDLRVYGSAQADIQNALARALAGSVPRSRPKARVVGRRAAQSVHTKTRPTATTTAKTHRAAARTPDRTRTLAGHSAEQPTLRLAASEPRDASGTRFPLAVAAAGVSALAAALVAVVSLRWYMPRRARH
jgi:hypothetical protein